MKEFVRDVRPKLLQHVKELVRRQLHTELPERGTTRPVLRWNIGIGDARRGQQSMPYKPGDPVYWTVYTYDGLGRTLSVRAPDGASTTTYSYSGNTVTVTDPAGNWKKFTMDGFGNLQNVVEPDASQTSTGGTAASNYVYDALNHLTTVIMGRQMPGGNTVWQTRTFNYVFNGSITAYLLSATNPENGTVSYAYYSDGTLFSKTDAKGQTLKYARDSYGRVLTVSLAGSPDTVLRTYTYDTNPVDNAFSQNSNGRVTTVQYAVPSISRTFDNSWSIHGLGR